MEKQKNRSSLGLWMFTISVYFCLSDGQTLGSTERMPIARSQENIGNPWIDKTQCGRNGQQSYICDPDNVLTVNGADELDVQIKGIRNSMPCPCTKEQCQAENLGYLVTIAVVNKLKWTNGSSDNIPDNNDDHAWQMQNWLITVRMLAFDLLQKWNLGRCKESILVLFSRTDNVLYTVTESVAGRVLTDDLIGEIAMDVRSEFSQNATTGFQKLLTEYKAVFNGTYKHKTKWDNANMPEAYPVVGASSNSLVIFVYFYSLVTIAVTVLMQL